MAENVEIDWGTFKPNKNLKFKNDSVRQELEGTKPEFRSFLESLPATLTSGFRTKEANASVGGVPNSYHTTGEGADIRWTDDPVILDKITSAGYEYIDEGDHLHIQPSKNTMGANSTQKSQPEIDWNTFTPNAATAAPEKDGLESLFNPKPTEPVQRSPLGLMDRYRASFGNNEGIVQDLKNKGLNAEIKDGEVYVDGRPIDPDSMPGLLALSTPIQDPTDQQGNFKEIQQFLGDLGGDIMAAPAGAIGSIPIVGTKLKQKLGEGMGTYKDTGEGFINQEMINNLPADLGALLLGPLAKGLTSGRNAMTKVANKIMPELPEKMWARGANLGEMMGSTKEEIAKKVQGTATEAPRYIQKIRTVMKRNYPQKADALLNAAEKDRLIVGAEKNARLEKIPDINMDQVEANVRSAKIPDKVTAGSRKNARKKVNNALDEIKANSTQEESGGFEMRNSDFPDYDTWKNNLDEKFLSRKKTSGSVSTGKPSKATENDVLGYKLDQAADRQVNRNPESVKGSSDIVTKKGGVNTRKPPAKIQTKPQVGSKYELDSYPKKEVEGSKVKSGKIQSDAGKGKDYYRKPTEDELKLMYESEKNASEKQVYEGPKKVTNKISAKNLEEEKTKFSKQAYSKSQLKKTDSATRNKELADKMREEVYNADEMVSDGGRKLKDINLEYDPLRATTEAMQKKINLSEKGEGRSSVANFARRNPAPAILDSLGDLADLLGRKTGQGLFNFKNTPKLDSKLGIKDIPKAVLLQKLLSGELDDMLQ